MTTFATTHSNEDDESIPTEALADGSVVRHPLTDASRLGVVILTHGTTDEWRPLVSSLLDEHGADPDSIVIVHNPVTADDPHLDPPDQRVTVLRPEYNLGYSKGMNLGLRHHLDRGVEAVFMLTHEVRLRDGAFQRMLETLDANPRYGALGPVLYYRDDADRLFSKGGRVSPTGEAHHMPFRDAVEGADGVIECDWVDGAAVLMRADVLREIGLINEDYFFYFEETNLCLRVRQAGNAIGVVAGAAGQQQPGESSRIGAQAYLMVRNSIDFARLAAGRRGTAAAVWRVVRPTYYYLRRLGFAALTRNLDDSKAVYARVRLIASWRGVFDYFRGRWGPPPADLPGAGDTSNTRG